MTGSRPATTTTNNSSASTTQANPALRAPYMRALDSAGKLFDAGVGAQPNTMSSVVPFSNQTMRGMDLIEDIAGKTNTSQPYTALTGMLGSGGLSALQNEAIGNFRATADQARAGGYSQPFLDVLNTAQNDAAEFADRRAAAAGRFNSAPHMESLGRGVAEVTAQMKAQELARQQSRGDYANQAMFNAGQTGQNNVFGAAQALPGAFDYRMAPARALMGVGGNYEDLARRTIDDRNRIFNEVQMSPWEQIARLQGAATGSAGLGSTTTTMGSAQGTAQAARQSPLLSALGGAASGFGAFGPIGGALGGLAGLLG